jgi:pyruvate dehydrogenase E1 component alpha subunit
MTVQDKEAGAAVEAQPAKNGFSLIPGEKLQQLYITMLKCRILEERVQSLVKQGTLHGSYASLPGREAAVAGIVGDLTPEDALGLSDRDLAASFVKGVPLEELIRRIFGHGANAEMESASTGQVGFASMNMLAPVNALSSRLGLSIKLAQANKLDRNGKVAVVFCGDEPAAQDSWHEALKIASRQELPIIFVFHSNFGGKTESPEPPAKSGDNNTRAPGDEIPLIPVDGSDVVAVYRVASESITRARKGSGPTIVECVSFGLEGKTAVSHAKQRLGQELSWRKAGDPIAKMEGYLTRKGLFSAGLSTQVCLEFNKELDAAIVLAEKLQRR